MGSERGPTNYGARYVCYLTVKLYAMDLNFESLSKNTTSHSPIESHCWLTQFPIGSAPFVVFSNRNHSRRRWWRTRRLLHYQFVFLSWRRIGILVQDKAATGERGRSRENKYLMPIHPSVLLFPFVLPPPSITPFFHWVYDCGSG